MEIPPGLVYIFGALPRQLAPSIFTYLALSWARFYDAFCVDIPSWIIVAISLLASPALYFGRSAYTNWKNARSAAAAGADLPPFVEQSTFATIKELKHMVEEGYPGTSYLTAI